MPISLRLRRDFELVHEPLVKNEAEVFAEEKKISLKLRERLRNSSGGTFLVTGFRGVGKTTVVHQALKQLNGQYDAKVISVTVPVARPVSTGGLLFEVIRRLVERLSETGILKRLTPTVQDRLLTAYARTSVAVRETSTSSQENSRTLSLGGPISAGEPKVTLPLPRWSRTRTKAESQARELSFLAYSDGDVEHDFLNIVALLGRADAVRRGRLARVASAFGWGSSTQALDSSLVIVFDEIDKLTEADGGLRAFEEMLGGLKNLLASSGVHFVVVGGVDLHDEWLRESATANSLYRSVFAWQGYVGCSWDAAALLLDDAVADHSADKKVLADYLTFRGRGIIRNVLYELNELVEWDEDGPFIHIAGTAEDRVRLLADLGQVLDGVFEGADRSMLAAPSDNDRLRQASYFTVDWVLRAGSDAFTVGEALDPGRGTPLDSVLRPSEDTVHAVLQALAQANYLDVDERDSETATQGPEAERYREQYKLSSHLQQRLALIAGASPKARAEFGRDQSDLDWSGDGGESRKALQNLLGERYLVRDRIGQGGFGTVWSGLDVNNNRKVAFKVIRTPNEEARRRALQESEMLRRIKSPGVVRIIETFPASEKIVLVTELVEGSSLADLIALPPSIAVHIAIQLAETVAHLHDISVIHADIKPSNIMFRSNQRAVLVDLGTARLSSASRRPGSSAWRDRTTLSGTPLYMAPEQLMGERANASSDVWSLGILLLETLTGRAPHLRTPEALAETVGALPFSVSLKEALLRALDENPQRRPTALEWRDQLLQTPEGRESSAPSDE